MTEKLSTELVDYRKIPRGLPSGASIGGHVRVHRATITMASQPTSNTILVAVPSKGDIFLYGMHTTTATLGSTTVAIGVTGTVAKYKAAATFTAADTPTLFGKAAAMTELTAAEEIFITLAAAAMPAAGTYVVDMYFAGT